MYIYLENPTVASVRHTMAYLWLTNCLLTDTYGNIKIHMPRYVGKVHMLNNCTICIYVYHIMYIYIYMQLNAYVYQI